MLGVPGKDLHALHKLSSKVDEVDRRPSREASERNPCSMYPLLKTRLEAAARPPASALLVAKLAKTSGSEVY